MVRSALLMIIFLTGCLKINNDLDDVVLSCGLEVKGTNTRFIPIENAGDPSLLHAGYIGKIGDEVEPLKVTSRGCVSLSAAQKDGWLLIRGPGRLGLFEKILDIDERAVSLSKLQVDTNLDLECPLSPGSDRYYGASVLQMSVTHNSPTVYFEHLIASANESSALEFTTARQSINIDLSALNAGEYSLKLKLFDYRRYPDNILITEKKCRVSVDSTAPVGKDIPSVGPLAIAPQTVVDLGASDTSPFRTLVCWRKMSDTRPCTDYREAKSPELSPIEGDWKLHYYYEDIAGNRSPLIVRDISVYNQSILNSIRKDLVQANLMFERRQFLLSLEYLVKAYSKKLKLQSDLELSSLGHDVLSGFVRHALTHIASHQNEKSDLWEGKTTRSDVKIVSSNISARNNRILTIGRAEGLRIFDLNMSPLESIPYPPSQIPLENCVSDYSPDFSAIYLNCIDEKRSQLFLLDMLGTTRQWRLIDFDSKNLILHFAGKRWIELQEFRYFNIDTQKISEPITGVDRKYFWEGNICILRGIKIECYKNLDYANPILAVDLNSKIESTNDQRFLSFKSGTGISQILDLATLELNQLTNSQTIDRLYSQEYGGDEFIARRGKSIYRVDRKAKMTLLDEFSEEMPEYWGSDWDCGLTFFLTSNYLHIFGSEKKLLNNSRILRPKGKVNKIECQMEGIHYQVRLVLDNGEDVVYGTHGALAEYLPGQRGNLPKINNVESLTISPNQKWAASTAEWYPIEAFQIFDLKGSEKPIAPGSDKVMAFDNQFKNRWAIAEENSIRIVSLENEPDQLIDISGEFRHLTFTSEDTLLAFGNKGKVFSVSIKDSVVKEEMLLSAEHFQSMIKTLVVPNARVIIISAITREDVKTVIYDTEKFLPLRSTIPETVSVAPQSTLTQMDASDSGRFIAGIAREGQDQDDSSGTVYVFEIDIEKRTFKTIRAMDLPSMAWVSIFISGGEENVRSVSHNGDVYTFNLETMKSSILKGFEETFVVAPVRNLDWQLIYQPAAVNRVPIDEFRIRSGDGFVVMNEPIGWKAESIGAGKDYFIIKTRNEFISIPLNEEIYVRKACAILMKSKTTEDETRDICKQ